MHNKTSSAFQLAPAVYGSPFGGIISADSYYNPFGVEFSRTQFDYRSRFAALGNRRVSFGTNTDQVQTGFKGTFSVWNDQQWNWEVGMDYGHVSLSTTTYGLPNLNIINQATGPSFLGDDGVVHCGTPGAIINDCTPINIFNLEDPNTLAVLRTASSPASSGGFTQEKVWRGDMNGGLFELPAGTMQLAVGASYRKEYTHTNTDTSLLINPTTGNCVLGSQCASPLQGGYNVKEVYAELFVPILKDMPFVHALNLTLGDRYSKYNNFGNTNNTKVALEWRPIEDLLLRGTVSQVFRAPTVLNLFGAAANDAPRLSHDPCDGYTGNPPNPACVNVPTDGTFHNQSVAQQLQINAITSGSEFAGFPLGPELGKSFDWGVVYDPHFIEGLSVSADYWRLYLNNIITNVGAQSVLDLCAAGQLAYCSLFTRNATGPNQGQILTMLEPTGNLGRVDVKGVDFALNYRLPEFSFGRFNIGFNATYLEKYDVSTAPGTDGEYGLSLRRSFPDVRLVAGGRVRDGRRFGRRVPVPALARAKLGELAARRVRCVMAHALHRPLPHGLAIAVTGRIPGGHVLLRRLLHDPRPVLRLRRDGLQRHPDRLQHRSLEHAFRHRREQPVRQAAAVPVREQHQQRQYRSGQFRSAGPLLLRPRHGEVLVLKYEKAAQWNCAASHAAIYARLTRRIASSTIGKQSAFDEPRARVFGVALEPCARGAQAERVAPAVHVARTDARGRRRAMHRRARSADNRSHLPRPANRMRRCGCRLSFLAARRSGDTLRAAANARACRRVRKPRCR